MNSKYEFSGETLLNNGKTLFRIRATKDFGDVKTGDLGGWIEGEWNLEHDGNARVCGNARVFKSTHVLVVSGLGRIGRTTTAFICDGGEIRIACGCFGGGIAEFRKKVKETHGDTIFAKEYEKLTELIEMHFAKEKEGR